MVSQEEALLEAKALLEAMLPWMAWPWLLEPLRHWSCYLHLPRQEPLALPLLQQLSYQKSWTSLA